MTENNVYATYNFEYNFSNTTLYINIDGFSSAVGDNIFEFTTTSSISASSAILYVFGMNENVEIHLTVLDETNSIIGGTEHFYQYGPAIKSTYTFTNPVNTGKPFGSR